MMVGQQIRDVGNLGRILNTDAFMSLKGGLVSRSVMASFGLRQGEAVDRLIGDFNNGYNALAKKNRGQQPDEGNVIALAQRLLGPLGKEFNRGRYDRLRNPEGGN
jgi:hypothetical protein